MINIIFCGYRKWAKDIFCKVSKHPNINVLDQYNSKDEYDNNIYKETRQIDILLFVGWSWIIESKITSKYLCLGIHPSDLPMYRGGSPLQHQIIDGISESKISLITLSSDKIDSGNIWMKHDVKLIGDNMDSVFNNIVNSSIGLLNTFFYQYPDISPTQQNIKSGSYKKRRTPEESHLSMDDLKKMSLQEIYNFIRCLTDPYPNAYIEDENGNKLLFTEVKYLPNKK